METFKKFSSGFIIMMSLMVIPPTSCNPVGVRQSLEEAFSQFRNFTVQEICIFPSPDNVGINPESEFPEDFPLKACSSENELGKVEVSMDEFEYGFSVELCFLFFNKSRELCHDGELTPENLGKMTRDQEWDVCASAGDVLKNSFMTKHNELCKSVCEGDETTAHVCRLLIAALVKHEEGITAETTEKTADEATTKKTAVLADEETTEKTADEATTKKTADEESTEKTADEETTKKTADEESTKKTADEETTKNSTDENGNKNEEGMAVPALAVRDSSSFKFFLLLVAIMGLILAAYILYHKRKVLIACIMERGESDSSPTSEGPKSKVKYSKLKADEDLPYLDRSITTRNYIY